MPPRGSAADLEARRMKVLDLIRRVLFPFSASACAPASVIDQIEDRSLQAGNFQPVSDSSSFFSVRRESNRRRMSSR